MTYIRDPQAIYQQSFEIIRRDSDLVAIPESLRDVVVRMIHACGMLDLAADIVGAQGLTEAVEDALERGSPVLCDCEMVRAGIIAKNLRRSELMSTLGDPAVPAIARRLGTTRSAAAVELWRSRLAGAVVVIGNAPTALFHLLELLGQGAPGPAAIIATPVGFVGAAESKALLAAGGHDVPFLTVRGRRGGSAIAAAAFNAIAERVVA
jgi:precorrin-8X/cobalt-precorrin-8 methylmutase